MASNDIGTAATAVGLAAKGASLAGIGAGTALAAAIPVVGWAAAAVSLAATLFGGGGDGYTSFAGYKIKGSLSPAGFAGTVTATDNKGNQWDSSDYGSQYLTPLAVATFKREGLADSGLSIPLDFKTADYDAYTPVRVGLDAVLAKLKMENNTTPNQTTAAAGAAALAPSSSSSAASSTPGPAPVLTFGLDAGTQQLILWAIAGAVAWHVLGGKA